MKIKKFVQDTCMNWNKGTCEGLDIDKKGNLRPFQKPGHPCNICEGKPCDYLRKLIDGLIHNSRDKHNQKQLDKVREEYEKFNDKDVRRM